jgi:hypothetical protein
MERIEGARSERQTPLNPPYKMLKTMISAFVVQLFQAKERTQEAQALAMSVFQRPNQPAAKPASLIEEVRNTTGIPTELTPDQKRTALAISNVIPLYEHVQRRSEWMPASM